MVEGDAPAVASPRPRASAASSSCTSASARPPCAGALVLDLARAARALPCRARCPRWSWATIEEDLARRDFTVNAIAVALADGTMAQVEHAEEDLRAGRRACSTTRRSPTTRRGCSGSPATPRGSAAPSSPHGRARGGGGLDGVSGERLGAELRLLLDEPQPAALEALARYAPALLLGLTPTGPTACWPHAAHARRDLLALAAAWPWTTSGCCSGSRPPTGGSSACARADAVRARSTPRTRRWPCGATAAQPVEVAVLAGGERARRWIAEWRHARAAVSGVTVERRGCGGRDGGARRAATDALLDGRR